MLRKHKNVVLAGALAVSLAAIGLLYATNYKDVTQRVALNDARNTAGATRSPGAMIKDIGPRDKEGRRRSFERFVKEGGQYSFAAPADTSAALSFKLKYPKLKTLGKPIGVYVDQDENKENRKASIYYGDPGDGILVTAVKFSKVDKIDFKERVGEDEKNKKTGVFKGDSTPFLVEVNGYEGYACEPGYNVVLADKAPRPGFVQWQEDDDVVYSVYGTYGPNGTSVKELLEIARSMSE